MVLSQNGLNGCAHYSKFQRFIFVSQQNDHKLTTDQFIASPLFLFPISSNQSSPYHHSPFLLSSSPPCYFAAFSVEFRLNSVTFPPLSSMIWLKTLKWIELGNIIIMSLSYARSPVPFNARISIFHPPRSVHYLLSFVLLDTMQNEESKSIDLLTVVVTSKQRRDASTEHFSRMPFHYLHSSFPPSFDNLPLITHYPLLPPLPLLLLLRPLLALAHNSRCAPTKLPPFNARASRLFLLHFQLHFYRRKTDWYTSSKAAYCCLAVDSVLSTKAVE